MLITDRKFTLWSLSQIRIDGASRRAFLTPVIPSSFVNGLTLRPLDPYTVQCTLYIYSLGSTNNKMHSVECNEWTACLSFMRRNSLSTRVFRYTDSRVYGSGSSIVPDPDARAEKSYEIIWKWTHKSINSEYFVPLIGFNKSKVCIWLYFYNKYRSYMYRIIGEQILGFGFDKFSCESLTLFSTLDSRKENPTGNI